MSAGGASPTIQAPTSSAPQASAAAAKIRGSGLRAPARSETAQPSTSPSSPVAMILSSWVAGPLVTMPIRQPAVRSATSASIVDDVSS